MPAGERIFPPPARVVSLEPVLSAEKVPATILSRVQRYNFQKMSTNGIMHRLAHILHEENIPEVEGGLKAVELIAKMADGGMRDAITLLDKCLSYSNELTVDNVIKALGVADYDTMVELTDALVNKNVEKVIEIVNRTYNSGIDLKQFIKTYFEFILDCNIYSVTKNTDYVKIPDTYIDSIGAYSEYGLLPMLVDLQNSIKYENNPKAVILARFILFMGE